MTVKMINLFKDLELPAEDFLESGGGFSSYLSMLRRNGLIETHAHMAKASGALFP